MASRLENLIPELFFEVANYLSPKEIVSLSRCSSVLERRARCDLLYRNDCLNQTMRYACANGDSQLIRRAVTNGSTPSTASLWGGHTMLTLTVAALRGQSAAFKTLIELGARLDDPTANNLAGRLQSFMKIFPWGTCPDVAREYLRSGLHTQIAAQCGKAVALPLVKAISLGTPPDVVQLLLDNGADPNHGEQRAPHQALVHGDRTPLLAALESYGSSQTQTVSQTSTMVEMLVDGGARIQGGSGGEQEDPENADDDNADNNAAPAAAPVAAPAAAPTRPLEYPTNIPVILATRIMAVDPRGRALLDTLIKCGADINQSVEVVAPRTTTTTNSTAGTTTTTTTTTPEIYTTTPLRAYIDAIADLDSHSLRKHRSATAENTPACDIAYLISLGAHDAEFASAPSSEEVENDERLRHSSITFVDRLVEKWGLARLSDAQGPELGVLRSLLSTAAATTTGVCVRDLLISKSREFESVASSCRDLLHPREVRAGWRNLVELLVPVPSASSSVDDAGIMTQDVDKLLREFVVGRFLGADNNEEEEEQVEAQEPTSFEQPEQAAKKQTPEVLTGDLFLSTVDRLLEAGADLDSLNDIAVRTVGVETFVVRSKLPSDQRALFRLVETWCRDAAAMTSVDAKDDARVFGQKRTVIRELVKRGADPWSDCGEGRTPLGLAKETMKGMGKDGRGVAGREQCLRFVGELMMDMGREGGLAKLNATR